MAPPEAFLIQRATGSFSRPALSTRAGQGARSKAAEAGSSPANVAAKGGARRTSSERRLSSLTSNGRPSPSARASTCEASPARGDFSTQTCVATASAAQAGALAAARRRRSASISMVASRVLTRPSRLITGLSAQASAVIVSLTKVPDLPRPTSGSAGKPQAGASGQLNSCYRMLPGRRPNRFSGRDLDMLQRETPRGLGAEMPVGCGELGDACCVLAIEDGEQAAVVGAGGRVSAQASVPGDAEAPVSKDPRGQPCTHETKARPGDIGGK